MKWIVASFTLKICALESQVANRVRCLCITRYVLQPFSLFALNDCACNDVSNSMPWCILWGLVGSHYVLSFAPESGDGIYIPRTHGQMCVSSLWPQRIERYINLHDKNCQSCSRLVPRSKRDKSAAHPYGWRFPQPLLNVKFPEPVEHPFRCNRIDWFTIPVLNGTQTHVLFGVCWMSIIHIPKSMRFRIVWIVKTTAT